MSSSRDRVVARSRAAGMRETREALLAAALDAFAEQGFDAPSLDAICARAGLTRGAFYVHFRDREALVVAVVERVVATFVDAVVAGEGAAASLDETVARFAAAVARGADGATRGTREPLVAAGLLPLHRLLEAAHRSPVIRARLVAIAGEARERVRHATAAARDAGTVRDDVAPEPLATLLMAAALGVLIGAEVGVPLELDVLHGALRQLLAPAVAVTPRRRLTSSPRPRRRPARRP